MGWSVEWLVPNRVYIVHIYGDISLEEVAAGSTESANFVQAGTPPVHSIIDTLDVTSFPKSLSEGRRAGTVFQEPNLGWVCLLTKDRFMTFAVSVISQLSKKNFKAFNNPQDALNLLQRLDPTLPPILEYTDYSIR